jgi:predicted nucleic acid-binding protein
MPPAAAAYLVDTNVYVTAINEDGARARFEAFIGEHGPLLVSAIVVAEVLIGIPDTSLHQAAVRALGAGTAVVAPTADDWTRAATAVARLGGESITKSRPFWNDALLAAQCERLGLTLVTNNTADFRRLGRHLGVRAVAPFPRR